MMEPRFKGGNPALVSLSDYGTIGKNVYIWNFTTILPDVVLEDGVVIGSGCYIGRGSWIGHDTRIQHGVFLPNRSHIGSMVFIGPNVTFTDDKYPRVAMRDEVRKGPHYKSEPPSVGDYASIGAGAVILPGVTIGAGATVAAGAVVTKDVEPGSFVMGVPAQTYRTSDAGKLLTKELYEASLDRLRALGWPEEDLR